MTNHIIRYGLLLLWLPVMAACSADSVVTADSATDSGQAFVNGDELPISYAVSEEAVTRAETLGGDFRVCAWMYDGSTAAEPYNNGEEELWVGSQILEDRYRGETVSENAGVWSTEAMHYWPRSWFNVDFYATYPTTLPDIYVITDDSDPENTYNYKGITQTLTPGNAVTDMLYDFKTTNRDASDNGAVSLSFKHALSKVSFVGVTTNAGWHVQVSAMSLHNVCSTGIFDIKGGEWNAASLGSKTTYTLPLAGTGTVSFDDESDDATALTATGTPLMLIGQRLTAWDTASTIAVNDASDGPKGSYLQLTCLITSTANGGVEPILPASGTPTEIYVPLTNGTDGWQPGKHYIYTLHFGGGYDAEGNVNIVPVTMTTTVADWEEGTTTNGVAE